MKKVFTSLFAAALAVSVSAQTSMVSPAAPDVTDSAIKIVAAYNGASASAAQATPAKMSVHAAAIDEANAPQGTEKLFSTDMMCLMEDYVMDNTGIATRMRFADDGAVYIHDLFSTGIDYWINADRDIDENIVIPLHQQVCNAPNGKPLTLEVSVFKFGYGVMWSEVDSEATEYTLRNNGDGSYSSTDLALPWEERKYPILCDPEGKTYFLIGSLICTPVTDTVVTPPAGIESQDYSYSYFAGGYQQGELIKVVNDGDDIYVQGLCPALPEIWLKGTYVNGRSQVVFKSGQYMGASQYVHYFSAAHPNPLAGEENPDEPNWLKDGELICDVNAEGVIEFRADRYLAVTIAGDVAYTVKPRILAEYIETGVRPAKPIITEMWWMEVDFLGFVQPTLDVNGQYINPANLSWRLYFDGEPFTFETWEYIELPNDMTEIPYGYDDGWDFIFYEDAGEEAVAIYKSDYSNIGIQSIYRVNGKEYLSEIAFYGDISGAESVEADHGEVTGTVYHDLSGRQVINPADGVYLRTDTYSDGTSRTSRQLIRR